MTKRPIISVVIPAYNAARFIQEAIHSVLEQEYLDSEIIVVNDGSSDMDYQSLTLIHPSVRVICQDNLGVSAARNRGCDEARGAYIGLLDADDVWIAGKLHAQTSYLQANPEVAAVFSRGLRWPSLSGLWQRPNVHQPFTPDSAKPLSYSDFLLGMQVAPSSMLIHRKIWREIGGFDVSMRRGEDFDFYFRLSIAHRVALLRNLYVLYRDHADSTTRKPWNQNPLATVIKRSVRTLGLTDAFGNSTSPRKVRARLAYAHFQHGYSNFWSGRSVFAMTECARATALGGGLRPLAYCALSAIPGARSVLRALKSPVTDTARVGTETDSEAPIIEIPTSWITDESAQNIPPG